jgi:hypothetical protein
MRYTIKHLVMMAAVLVTTVAATATANAEVQMKVPFDFTVAGKIWPAGVYTVDKDPQFGTLTLKSLDWSKSSNWIICPGDKGITSTRVVLDFDVLGSEHALRLIRFGDKQTPLLHKHAKEQAYHEVQIGE